MKQTICIPVTTTANRLERRIEAAESGITAIKNLISDLEATVQKGGNIGITGNSNMGEKENSTQIAHFYIRKEIETEAIKEPLERIESLISKLKDEVKKLDEAIITEIAKEKPQE